MDQRRVQSYVLEDLEDFSHFIEILGKPYLVHFFEEYGLLVAVDGPLKDGSYKCIIKEKDPGSFISVEGVRKAAALVGIFRPSEEFRSSAQDCRIM